MPKIVLPDSHWVKASELDAVFRDSRGFDGSLASLLLALTSTAVYHVDPARVDMAGRAVPFFLGVNYQDGHSEGAHKIVVQRINDAQGQYLLFAPPGDLERRFYHQGVYSGRAPHIEQDVDSPGKIQRRFLFRGDSEEIFDDFKNKGFTFLEEPMSREMYEQKSTLSNLASKFIK